MAPLSPRCANIGMLIAMERFIAGSQLHQSLLRSSNLEKKTNLADYSNFKDDAKLGSRWLTECRRGGIELGTVPSVLVYKSNFLGLH